MAKAATRKATGPDAVTLTYDLFDLPTAQHKAGLAGLLLHIAHMRDRRPPIPVPEVLAQSATGATIRFTPENIQWLMDILYAAQPALVTSKSKQKGATPVKEDFVEETDEHGKTRRTKVFVYERCQPKCPYLAQHLGSEREAWLALWRDMLWAIPRAKPKTREPFEQRAKALPCKEGKAVWSDLCRVESRRANNRFHTTEVTGSLWLGAQAANAEAVPFRGRAEENLLLHFSPLVATVFMPRFVEATGKAYLGKRSASDKDRHFVVTVPDVTDLEQFVTMHPFLLASLSPATTGYRPAEAVIDIPAEGALWVAYHLAQLAVDKTTALETSIAVAAVEYLHVVKAGKNAKMMASGRVVPRPDLLEEYAAITGAPGGTSPYRNPLFRRALMLAMLDGEPWFRPFGAMFAKWPHRFFVPTDDSPKLSWFWADARAKLKEVTEVMSIAPQQPPDPNDRLAELVHRLVRAYVHAKALERSRVDVEPYKDGNTIQWDKVPDNVKGPYYKARREIAESMFMEFRSRRDQAFVEHFVARLGAVRQYLPEEDYRTVSAALLDPARRDDVKTLTLLSLSANS